MSDTTNPSDPRLKMIKQNGQQEAYLVLPPEERGKEFIRPYFTIYVHQKCKTKTIIGPTIAETYARNPKFYGATFCCVCGQHFPLKDQDGKPQFLWPNGTGVGE